MGDPNDNTESSSPRQPGDNPLHRLGPFRVESLISSGGMGAVYRAYDDSMKRFVALKILHPSMALSTSTQHRFAREAWIAGRLEHPAIVRVFSRGEEGGIPYLAMELVDGGSLAAEIDDVRKREEASGAGSLTADSQRVRGIVARFVELIDGLAYVHDQGFIHRDIKPQNILVSGPERRLRLTDFGIAHAADMTQMTRPGDFIGTIRYMSPEQLAAHRATVDCRTDIYSIGVTMYEALSLALPYDGPTEEQYIAAILGGRSTPIRKRNPRISRDLETVILTAIHPDPDRRYQTAAAMADDLRRVLENRPIKARREGSISRTTKFVVRHKAGAMAVGIVAIAALVGYLAIVPGVRSARNRELLLQTLRAAYQTKRSPADIQAGYAALIPELVRTVRNGTDDSVAYWFHRLHGAHPATSMAPSGMHQALMVGGGDINTFVEGEFEDSPYFVTRCRIMIAVDSGAPEILGAYAGYYSVLRPTSGFMMEASIDSLLKGQPGMHDLTVAVISEHYRDAEFYLRRPESAGTGSGGDSGFELVPKTTSSCWYGGVEKCRVVATDHRSPVTPFLVDTNQVTLPVYSSGSPK